jgi:hypothetical protein
MQIGASEVCMAEVRMPEGGPAKIGAIEVPLAKVGTGQTSWV